MWTSSAVAIQRKLVGAKIFREHSRRIRISSGHWIGFGKFRRRHYRYGNNMNKGVSACVGVWVGVYVCVCVFCHTQCSGEDWSSWRAVREREHGAMPHPSRWSDSTGHWDCRAKGAFGIPALSFHVLFITHSCLCSQSSEKYFNLMLQKPLSLSRLKLSTVNMTIAQRHIWDLGCQKTQKPQHNRQRISRFLGYD